MKTKKRFNYPKQNFQTPQELVKYVLKYYNDGEEEDGRELGGPLYTYEGWYLFRVISLRTRIEYYIFLMKKNYTPERDGVVVATYIKAILCFVLRGTKGSRDGTWWFNHLYNSTKKPDVGDDSQFLFSGRALRNWDHLHPILSYLLKIGDDFSSEADKRKIYENLADTINEYYIEE